jgi:predicted oxidoreductase
MKLIDQVKPEILETLERDVKIKYNASYELIITSLSNINRYRELSINQVDTLLTFLPDELHPNGRTDFYYGDYLLQKEYQV